MTRHRSGRFRLRTCCALVATTAVLSLVFACNAISGADRLVLVDTFDAGRPVTLDGPTAETDARPRPDAAGPRVSFDAKGTAQKVVVVPETSLSWMHTFGANANAVVISISYEAGTTTAPTVNVGTTVIPILATPTFVGKGPIDVGFAFHTMAGALLSDVAGTTQTVTVTFGSSHASSATSLSFSDVGSLGSVVTNGGRIGPATVIVDSSVRSMVAVGFGGTNSNFSDFNETVVTNFVLDPFKTWPHLMGYAQGANGLQFTASVDGDWQAKAIELQPK